MGITLKIQRYARISSSIKATIDDPVFMCDAINSSVQHLSLTERRLIQRQTQIKSLEQDNVIHLRPKYLIHVPRSKTNYETSN